MKISFIGLGAMGYPMAKHLAKHHEVTVWNRTADVAARHAAEHGTSVAEMLDFCAEAGVIITILPTSREVDAIVDHLAEDLRPGSLWIDCTSGDPESARRTAARLQASGVEYVDAPVTGGTPGAEAGTLTIMVGASAKGFERTEPILRAFGKKIVHVGEVGFGHALKAMNNAMLATHIWVASECLVSLRKMGMDLKTALEVINAGSGRSFVTEGLLPKRVLDGEWPLVFKLGLLDKDVRIAVQTMHEQHLPSPVVALTSQLYTAALANMGPEADYIDIVRYVTKLGGDEW